jgi:hypothetical protein
VLTQGVRDKIETTLNAIEPRGYTPLYYSILQALREMQDAPKPRQIIVITDGIDTKIPFGNLKRGRAPAHANVTQEMISTALKKAGNDKISIDIVTFDTAAARADRKNDAAFKDIDTIANDSGGQSHDARNAAILLQRLQQLLNPFKFTVQPSDPPPDSPLRLGKTWEVRPSPREPARYSVEVSNAQPRPVSTDVTLEGGEGLELFLTQNSLVHRRFGFDPNHLVARKWVENVQDLNSPRKFFIAAHLVEKQGNSRLIRVSVQNQDETQFSPRPRHLWAEITPVPPAPDGRVYNFFDLEFEEDQPVPVLRFVAPDWPAGSRQADVRLWLKFEEDGAVVQTIEAPVAERKEFRVTK